MLHAIAFDVINDVNHPSKEFCNTEQNWFV